MDLLLVYRCFSIPDLRRFCLLVYDVPDYIVHRCFAIPDLRQFCLLVYDVPDCIVHRCFSIPDLAVAAASYLAS